MSTATARARALITPTGVFVALVPIALGLIVYFGRDTTFWFDDWTWVEDRRPWDLHTFVYPHNDHLSIVPIAIYKLLFVTAGLDHYLPYRLVVTALHGLCATLVYLIVRRRAGAWPGVIAGILILFLGSAHHDIIWPFQIGFLGSIAGGLGAWLALDRRDTRGDVIAAICLALSIGSSSVGLPIAAGIFIELLLDGGFVQRRLLVAAGPLALYAPWYAVYGSGHTMYDTVWKALKWGVDAFTAAFGGLAGSGIGRGRVLLVIMALAVAARLARGWRPTPRAIGLAVTAVTFYGLTAFARQGYIFQPPSTSRYIYVGAVVIVLFAAELVRGTQPPAWALAGAGALALASAVVNFAWLDDRGAEQRAVATTTRIELGAIELARDYVAPSYMPPYAFVHAGKYLEAVADLGSSPAVPRGDLTRLSLDGRRLVDRTLQDMGGIRLDLQPSTRVGGDPPAVLSATGGSARLTFGCAVLVAAPGANATMSVAPRGARLRIVAATAPVQIRAARFGDGQGTPALGTASTGGRVDVVTVPDALRTPAWRVGLSTHGRALACSVR